MIKKIILAKPRGICAGVDRAVNSVKKALEVFGLPVYVKHEIVHNKTIVADLESKGAVTVEDVGQIPEGSVVVFSAHGSTPEQYEQAKKRNLRVIDATCPLVTKVHLEVHRFFKKSYDIVYIGQKNHIEGYGVRAQAAQYKKEIPILETVEDVRALSGFEKSENLIYLSQTTLNLSEVEKVVTELKKKFPQIIDPPSTDICYATTNRQKAVVELAKKADIVFVVGSETSSNSQKMVERVKEVGVESYLIDGLEDVDFDLLKNKETVGLSAGASAPEEKILEIVEYFENLGASVEEMVIVEEKMKFKMPNFPSQQK